MTKIVLNDSRTESLTFGERNEFVAGEYDPALRHIPRFVYHRFKCILSDKTIAVNVSRNVQNHNEPDEFRLYLFNNDIPCDWNQKDG